MADEVVVRYEPDGKVTVCIGEHCVTVPCAKPEPEHDPDLVRRPPRPPHRVQLRTDALSDLADDELRRAAVQEGPLKRGAERIWVERLDD